MALDRSLIDAASRVNKDSADLIMAALPGLGIDDAKQLQSILDGNISVMKGKIRCHQPSPRELRPDWFPRLQIALGYVKQLSNRVQGHIRALKTERRDARAATRDVAEAAWSRDVIAHLKKRANSMRECGLVSEATVIDDLARDIEERLYRDAASTPA